MIQTMMIVSFRSFLARLLTLASVLAFILFGMFRILEKKKHKTKRKHNQIEILFSYETYQIDETNISEQDNKQGNQVDQAEDGDIVAHDVRGSFAPLDTAAGVGALERVVRPAEQRQRGPRQTVENAATYGQHVRLGVYFANVKWLADDVVALQGQRCHHVDARAADKVHEKGATDTARL
jgi:hypothetical protein